MLASRGWAWRRRWRSPWRPSRKGRSKEGHVVLKVQVQTASKAGLGRDWGRSDRGSYGPLAAHRADVVGLYREALAKLICDESGEDKKAKIPSYTWQFKESDIIALCRRFDMGGVAVTSAVLDGFSYLKAMRCCWWMLRGSQRVGSRRRELEGQVKEFMLI